MWDRMFFGYDAYHIVLWFLIYSILGWVVESIYMSFCNKKLTNRGFARGPMCPIYGVGALTVFFVLRPYSDRIWLLFLLGATLATLLEYLTALIMKRIFGEVWWDYNEKPFNYKGILCLESTIAWGVYTVLLFVFLQNMVMWLGDRIPVGIGRGLGSCILLVYMVDFAAAMYREKKDSISDMKETLLEKKDSFLDWWMK